MSHDEEIKKLQEEAVKNRLAIANLSLLNAKKFSFLGWKACTKQERGKAYFQLYKAGKSITMGSVFLEKEAKKKILERENMNLEKIAEKATNLACNSMKDVIYDYCRSHAENYADLVEIWEDENYIWPGIAPETSQKILEEATDEEDAIARTAKSLQKSILEDLIREKWKSYK